MSVANLHIQHKTSSEETPLYGLMTLTIMNSCSMYNYYTGSH